MARISIFLLLLLHSLQNEQKKVQNFIRKNNKYIGTKSLSLLKKKFLFLNIELLLFKTKKNLDEMLNNYFFFKLEKSNTKICFNNNNKKCMFIKKKELFVLHNNYKYIFQEENMLR